MNKYLEVAQTHISYKTAKALKEFLGESAPEPMGRLVWINGKGKNAFKVPQLHPAGYKWDETMVIVAPAYQLHDLLSKPFCEAMAKAIDKHFPCPRLESYPNEEPFKCHPERPYMLIHRAYWDNGLPAVEAELMMVMGGK